MGVVLLVSVIFGSSWRFVGRTKENAAFHVLIVTSIIACVMDPLCFLCNGKPGRLMFFVVYWGNAVMYISEIIIGGAWIIYMTSHIGVSLSKTSASIIGLLSAFGAAALVVNRFVPFVYSVSADNLYSREWMFWYYFAIEIVFLFYGVLVYFRARRKSGFLKFFPVWAFSIPALIGAALQTVVYGISTINPFIAISVSCVTLSVQNELLFRDGLTGLYNRFFLTNALDRLKIKKRSGYRLVMMDINHFKAINDSLGHKEGDSALVLAAGVFEAAVNETGLVIRYGGDEFILILYGCDENKTDALIKSINSRLIEECRKREKPYELSVSAGSYLIDGDYNTFDEVLDNTDRKMYEAKRRYYSDNPFADRRKQ